MQLLIPDSLVRAIQTKAKFSFLEYREVFTRDAEGNAITYRMGVLKSDQGRIIKAAAKAPGRYTGRRRVSRGPKRRAGDKPNQ